MDRRPAAMLVADVVGYSRLMAADEAGTLAALKDRRRAILDLADGIGPCQPHSVAAGAGRGALD